MFTKKTPRIEYTAFIPETVVGKPIDPDVAVSVLPLESFTLKALDDAGIKTVGDAMDLLEKAASEATVELPKGIGKRRLKEIEAAIFVPAASGTTPDAAAAIIFGAMAEVAKRCGPLAVFHSGEVLAVNGKPAVRIRWSTASNHIGLVRRMKTADKHFHACPPRRMGADPIVDVLP